MRLRRVVLLSIVLTLIATPFVASAWIYDREFQFGFSIPIGFVKNPKKEQGKVLFAFQRPAMGSEKGGMFIQVKRLGGVLDRKKMKPKSDSPINPQVANGTEKWKEFDIEVFRAPEQVGDLQLVTFNAEVPLTPEAVQIAVTGNAAQENELRSVLRSVLESLKGQTNWIENEPWFRRITPLEIKFGFLMAIVVGVLWYVRRRILAGGLAQPNRPADRPRE